MYSCRVRKFVQSMTVRQMLFWRT